MVARIFTLFGMFMMAILAWELFTDHIREPISRKWKELSHIPAPALAAVSQKKREKPRRSLNPEYREGDRGFLDDVQEDL